MKAILDSSKTRAEKAKEISQRIAGIDTAASLTHTQNGQIADRSIARPAPGGSVLSCFQHMAGWISGGDCAAT